MAQATIDTTVAGLQGVPISPQVPTNGQVLMFNGTVWIATNPPAGLPLSGGTLTGPLVLSGNAVAPLNPVTLQQLQADYLLLTGGTLSGPLTVTNGVTVNMPSGSALGGLSVISPAGTNAAIYTTVTGTRNWWFGCSSQSPGDFVLVDQTQALVRWSVDNNNVQTIGGGTLVINMPAGVPFGAQLVTSLPGLARILYQLSGTRNWSCGANNTANTSVGMAGPGIFMIADETSGQPVMVCDTGGSLFAMDAFICQGTPNAPQANFNVISDPRVKNNVASYQTGLETLLKINPISYKYKPRPGVDGTKTHVGLDATELKSILPEAVVGMDVQLDLDSPERTTLDTLHTDPLIYVMLNAIKELAAQVASLRGAK